MPKLKTHSGAKKRFNLTKTGKVSALTLTRATFSPKKTPSAREASVRAPTRT